MGNGVFPKPIQIHFILIYTPPLLTSNTLLFSLILVPFTSKCYGYLHRFSVSIFTSPPPPHPSTISYPSLLTNPTASIPLFQEKKHPSTPHHQPILPPPPNQPLHPPPPYQNTSSRPSTRNPILKIHPNGVKTQSTPVFPPSPRPHHHTLALVTAPPSTDSGSIRYPRTATPSSEPSSPRRTANVRGPGRSCARACRRPGIQRG